MKIAIIDGHLAVMGSGKEPLPHLVAEIINRLHGLVKRKGK